MPTKLPPPTVAPETWKALLAAADDFDAMEPWEFVGGNDTVGLIDPITGETRIGTVLGKSREVFAAVFYRRGGLRWILNLLSNSPDPQSLDTADGMDCLKLEFVPKRELTKEDLAVLKASAFKPAAKGAVWPQFRSAEPGWHPWHLNQTEADQLLADLPRLSAFCLLYMINPDLYDGRSATEIPFLPEPLPNRSLTVKDLDWRPLLLPRPTGLEPFQLTGPQLEELRALERKPALTCEFDCRLIPGASFKENGRVCFGRCGMLVETQHGLVLGMEIISGTLPAGEAAGGTLVACLKSARCRPERIAIRGSRLQPVLQPLCAEIQIELLAVPSLSVLEEAIESISQYMVTGQMP